MTTNEYLINRNEKLKRDKTKNNFIFGIILGFVIFYMSIIRLLYSTDMTYDKLLVFFAVLGFLVATTVTIFPNIINRFYSIVKIVFGSIGKVLLRIILSCIYLVLVIPIGILMVIKEKISIKEKSTSFCNYMCSNSLNYKSRVRRLINFISLFTDEKYILMIPLIIILVIFGLVLFFAQTSVIAPFIYTLF